jgi:hypothetical protein
MRHLPLLSLAALGLAACGGDEQANNTVNIDQAVMSDDLNANDVTAIDAVTADAANMAADVDIDFTNDMLEGSGNRSGATPEGSKARPRQSAPRPETNVSPSAAQPAANTVANETN